MTQGVDVIIMGALAQVALSRRPEGHVLDAVQRARLVEVLGTLPPHCAVVMLWSPEPVLAASVHGGPDIPGPDDGVQPTLADLCRAVDACTVPVVFLIDGLVSGAAADVAVAARARIATPSARIVFGASRLGRISGAGTTQRLPHLVGIEAALALLGQAKPIPAPEALVAGLVDHIVEAEGPEDSRASAAIWLQQQTFQRRRPSALTDGRAALRAIAAARAQAVAGSLPDALAQCFEAALLLPADQGLAFEAAMAAERDALPATAALTHLVQAERTSARTPEGLRAVNVATVARPAFVGAAAPMAAVALMALARGLPLTVMEPDRDRLVPLLQAVATRQETAVQAGTLTPEQRDADWARLLAVADPAAIGSADLLIVAPERAAPAVPPSVPVLVMGRGALPKGAFRLVLSGRVAELGVPQPCPAQPAAQALAFLRRIGLTVVLTGVQSPSGISGALAAAAGGALRALLAMGVSADAILSALAGFGMTLSSLPKVEPTRPPRDMAAEEIVNRWLAALANEGARLLASGQALKAADVDVVAVHGLGLPAESGGPLHQADQRGLMILRRDLRLWAEDGEVWKPVPALDALVSVGRGFSRSLSQG